MTTIAVITREERELDQVIPSRYTPQRKEMPMALYSVILIALAVLLGFVILAGAITLILILVHHQKKKNPQS